MTISHPRALLAACAVVLAMVVLAVLFVHPDVFPALHTYGVSIGTNAHYLSIEFVRGHLVITAETAS